MLSVASAGCIGKIKEYVFVSTVVRQAESQPQFREGASVVLLEQTRHVGGLSTSGPMKNHLDRQTLGGLCEQFLEEAVKRSKGRWTEGGARTWQSGIAEQLFLEMLKQAGVEVRYEKLLDWVGKDDTHITELRVQGGEIYRAKVFVDATYEGDLMAKAGCPTPSGVSLRSNMANRFLPVFATSMTRSPFRHSMMTVIYSLAKVSLPWRALRARCQFVTMSV